jgi:prepilin-type N-terminal cleavage/methylation domain-containing protein
MMNHDGFTLIELIVAITVVGVLTLLLGTSLQGKMGAYRLEGEVKQLKTDLMAGRARAMQRNVTHFLQINMATNDYQLFQDANGNGTLEAGADLAVFPNPKAFKDPLLSGGGTITIDTRGLMGGGAMVSFNSSSHEPSDYDCLAMSPTRIAVGKLNGASCDAR